MTQTAGATYSAPSTPPRREVVETITGLVEATNDKGIRVNGEWLNFSKYHQVEAPVRGQRVELRVNGRFIVGLKPLEAPTMPAVSAPRAAAPAPQPARDLAPQAASAVARAAPTARQEDAQRRRLALVQAAATFCANRPDFQASDVLDVAAEFEAWVLR